MIAARDLRIQALQPAPATMLRMLIEPVCALGCLLVATLWFEPEIGPPYVILALLVLAMTFPGRTSQATSSTPLGLAIDLVGRWIIVSGLLLLLAWSTRTLSMFDARVLLVWLAATPLTQVAAHFALPRMLGTLLESEAVQRTAVIAGANEMGRMLAERLQRNPVQDIRFAGYFDDRGKERLGDIDETLLLGSMSDLAEFVKSHHVDVIYCALPMCSQPRTQRMLEDLRDTTASIYFVPDILLFDLIQARVDFVGGIPVIAVCESPFYGFNAVVKRVSDLLLASAILVLIAPLLLAIGIAVKLSSPGPVLFKQRRYGLDGREIVVYKFRTMTVWEDGDEVKQATKNDPRTTPLGRVLRQYSLDELPQFINVLQGRMSVVGPRPHAVAHNEMYRKLIRGYMMRHKVKPGITGLAQIRGLRGETDTVEKMRARIDCDLEYLRNWSLWFDLVIVLQTLRVMTDRKNAY